MSQFEISISSKALQTQTCVSIILPAFEDFDDTIPEGEKFQTLWLLHGGHGDHTDYVRKTAVEFWALKHRLAVVTPYVGNSFYTDLPDGPQYYTYVSEELPRLLRKYFPLSDKREDNFIAGLSMGGFGAAKIAFNNPEKYAAVGLMSTGPIGPHQLTLGPDRPVPKSLGDLFGGMDKVPGTINDIWHVLENAIKKGVDLPKIYDCCGREDFAYPHYCAFKEFAQKLGLEVTYEEGPGIHDWMFWQEYLPKIIEWLPAKH